MTDERDIIEEDDDGFYRPDGEDYTPPAEVDDGFYDPDAESAPDEADVPDGDRPVSAEDEEPAEQAVTESATDEEDAAEADIEAEGGDKVDGDAEPTPEAAARQPMDPVARIMLVFAVFLIVVLLGTTAAMAVYLSSQRKAPRTSVEREVLTWETAVKERPKEVTSWTKLAYAYAAAERYDEAFATIERARGTVKADPSLDVVEADVLRAAGRHREAVEAYDKAQKSLADRKSRYEAELKRKGVSMRFPSETEAMIKYGRALSYHELGDLDKALADAEAAVKILPQQSAMQVTLGDFYAENGDSAKAENAYRQALLYIPDYADAIEGLEKLGKEK